MRVAVPSPDMTTGESGTSATATDTKLLHIMISISPISPSVSQSVWTLKVNPFTGSCRVRWFKGCLTEYTFKTRKRDILALMMAGDRSLGQWVNWHMRNGIAA